MSVIVTGMELPNSCYVCDLAQFPVSEKPYCRRTMRVCVPNDCRRPDWCPLREAGSEA